LASREKIPSAPISTAACTGAIGDESELLTAGCCWAVPTREKWAVTPVPNGVTTSAPE
jgi:hypothetical protein